MEKPMGVCGQTRGYLITIEGIDGAGKTEIGQRLRQYLLSKKKLTLLYHEPGVAPPTGLLPEEKLAHYVSDRLNSVTKFYAPMLEACGIVICDRFTHTTIAYQHYGDGLPLNQVMSACDRVTLKPDLTIWLDLPVSVAVQRITQRDGVAPTDEEITYLQRVSAGYSELAAGDPNMRWVLASLSAEHTWQGVRAIVDEFLASR